MPMVWQDVSPFPLTRMDAEEERELRLAAQARAGAEWALAALVARYQPPVLRYLVRLTGSADHARAIAEQVFVRMEQRMRGPHGAAHLRLWLLRASTEAGLDALRHPTRASKPAQLDGPRHTRGLLPGRTANPATDRLRAGLDRLVAVTGSTRRQVRQLIWNTPEATPDPMPGEPRVTPRFAAPAEDPTLDALDPREALRHKLVRAVLAELPYGDAQCLALHLVAGLNQAEVARALGLKPSAARKRIVTGLQLFAHRYEAAAASLGIPAELAYGVSIAGEAPVTALGLDDAPPMGPAMGPAMSDETLLMEPDNAHAASVTDDMELMEPATDASLVAVASHNEGTDDGSRNVYESEPEWRDAPDEPGHGDDRVVRRPATAANPDEERYHPTIAPVWHSGADEFQPPTAEVGAAAETIVGVEAEAVPELDVSTMIATGVLERPADVAVEALAIPVPVIVDALPAVPVVTPDGTTETDAASTDEPEAAIAADALVAANAAANAAEETLAEVAAYGPGGALAEPVEAVDAMPAATEEQSAPDGATGTAHASASDDALEVTLPRHAAMRRVTDVRLVPVVTAAVERQAADSAEPAVTAEAAANVAEAGETRVIPVLTPDEAV